MARGPRGETETECKSGKDEKLSNDDVVLADLDLNSINIHFVPDELVSVVHQTT